MVARMSVWGRLQREPLAVAVSALCHVLDRHPPVRSPAITGVPLRAHSGSWAMVKPWAKVADRAAFASGV
jgi:hypothetical protein